MEETSVHKTSYAKSRLMRVLCARLMRRLMRNFRHILCAVLWRPCTGWRLRRILFRRALPKMRSGVSEQILPNPFGSQKSYAFTEVLCMSYAEPYAVLCGASTGLRAKWRPKPCPEETRIPTMSYAESYARPKAHKTFQKSCFRVYVLCAFDPA